MEVIARINTSTASGRKIVRELEKNKAVELEYPLPEAIACVECKPLEELIEYGWDKLSELYGVDMRKI